MLNTKAINVKQTTPKQQILAFLGRFFYQKKLNFYHSGATKIFFQKCKKHPNKKSDFIFLRCQTYRCGCTTNGRCKHWHPSAQQQYCILMIQYLYHTLFQLFTISESNHWRYYPIGFTSKTIGFLSSNHRVLILPDMGLRGSNTHI